MQRLRERQLLEKLQQSHAESCSNSAKDEGRIGSFLPHIDKCKLLCIVPTAFFHAKDILWTKLYRANICISGPLGFKIYMHDHPL